MRGNWFRNDREHKLLKRIKKGKNVSNGSSPLRMNEDDYFSNFN